MNNRGYIWVRVSLSHHSVIKMLDDNCVIANIKEDIFLTVNETAAYILDLLIDKGMTVDQAAHDFAKRVDICYQRAHKDINLMVNDLLENKIITISQSR